MPKTRKLTPRERKDATRHLSGEIYDLEQKKAELEGEVALLEDFRNRSAGFAALMHAHNYSFSDISGELGGARLANNSVTKAKLPTNVVDNDLLAPSSTNYSHLIELISGPGGAGGGASAQNDKALRRIAGSGNSLSAAASNHSHSIQFDTLTREIREMFIEKRRRVREIKAETDDEEKRDLAGFVLALSHLLMDDEHYDAEERERRLLEDSDFRRSFLDKHRHDYGHSHEDGGEGMKLRRKGGYLLTPHPDLMDSGNSN